MISAAIHHLSDCFIMNSQHPLAPSRGAAEGPCFRPATVPYRAQRAKRLIGAPGRAPRPAPGRLVDARPSKLITPAFVPCSPLAPPTEGLDSNPVQVGPDSFEVFNTINQWTGPVTGSQTRWYRVFAGATGPSATPAHVPAVWLNLAGLRADGCAVNEAKVGTFTNTAADGPLRLVWVNGTVVHLVTVNGQPWRFDLIGHQFSR